MSLFDQLVDEAIKHNDNLASLRVVVEKELLHHDIIREMSRAGLLDQLTLWVAPVYELATVQTG